MNNNVFVVWEDDERPATGPDPTDISSLFDESADLPIKYADDPLTLACTSYRMWTEKSWTRWSRLEDIAEEITEADRAMAQNIRDYYISKLTFARLCGVNFTKFQQELSEFLIDKRVLKTSEQGLLYCLPYFYVEDCGKDWVFDNTVPVPAESDEHPFPSQITFEGLILSPVKEVYAFRKNTGDKHLFWFRDQKNHPYVIEVRSGNTLISLFRSLFKRQRIKINCTGRVVRLSGYRGRQTYYKLLNPEFVE
jgi:hypothetical protein